MVDSDTRTMVVTHRAGTGMLAGILGCVFGILGIFTFGIIFVPLAAICAVIGLVRGIAGGSASGIGTSVLAGALSVIGFSVSPSLWLLLGGALLASHLPGRDQAAIDRTQARPPFNVEEANRERILQHEQQFVASLNSLFQHIDHSRQYADQELAKFPAVENRYRTITSLMASYLDRERSLVNNPNAAVTRGRISVAISQGLNATEQLHNRVLALQQSLTVNGGPLLRAINSYEHACRDGLANNFIDASLSDTRNSLCARLSTEGPHLQQKFEQFARGLQHLEVVYRQESTNEKSLERESMRIE